MREQDFRREFEAIKDHVTTTGDRIVSQLTDAVNNLKKEVGETLVAVQTKIQELRDIINGGGQVTIDDINAASAQLDALQATLGPEPPPTT